MQEDNIKDFGEWNVPSKWQDVTLSMMMKLERLYEQKEQKPDILEIVSVLCDKPLEEIENLPLEFGETIMRHISFISTPIPKKQPTNTLTIAGETYTANIKEKLKVKEYLAAETVMRNDKYDYPTLLAILLRKEGEIYDSKFENEILEERRKMFENVPAEEALRVVTFFTILYQTLQINSLQSTQKEGQNHTHKDTENSKHHGLHWERFTKYAKKILKK